MSCRISYTSLHIRSARNGPARNTTGLRGPKIIDNNTVKVYYAAQKSNSITIDLVNNLVKTIKCSLAKDIISKKQRSELLHPHALLAQYSMVKKTHDLP